MSDRDDEKWLPTIPPQRQPEPAPEPAEGRVQCAGCPDTAPAREITEYAGYALCGDCHLDAAERLDREITRWLATVTA